MIMVNHIDANDMQYTELNRIIRQKPGSEGFQLGKNSVSPHLHWGGKERGRVSTAQANTSLTCRVNISGS